MLQLMNRALGLENGLFASLLLTQADDVKLIDQRYQILFVEKRQLTILFIGLLWHFFYVTYGF